MNDTVIRRGACILAVLLGAAMLLSLAMPERGTVTAFGASYAYDLRTPRLGNGVLFVLLLIVIYAAKQAVRFAKWTGGGIAGLFRREPKPEPGFIELRDGGVWKTTRRDQVPPPPDPPPAPPSDNAAIARVYLGWEQRHDGTWAQSDEFIPEIKPYHPPGTAAGVTQGVSPATGLDAFASPFVTVGNRDTLADRMERMEVTLDVLATHVATLAKQGRIAANVVEADKKAAVEP